MKIDREQIEKMAQTMCGLCTEDKSCAIRYSTCSEVASQDCSYKESAEELICKGYGKVSEYKAEIEQLKAKNKVLGDGVVKAFTNGFNTGREQVEKDIRRAKINILNKLKENAIEIGIDTSEFDNIEFVEVDAIDELIKEVENEKV